ncbi:hypothetical protein [Streptomyces sp. NPDC001315]|uniref:hypothetical protein n=1 Tax=Streptomyces sp. NPDC001315 TaxID=3364562 RepID=UPI003675B59C
MTSHVERAIAERIARVRAEEERKRLEREEQARRRAAGLAKRNARRLYNLAQRGLELAPPTTFNNTSLAASGAL